MHKMTEKILRKVLHFLEGVIAIMTLIVMVGMVGYEVYKMLTVNGYFAHCRRSGVCANADRHDPR